MNNKIQQLLEFGLDQYSAQQYLEIANGNLDMAVSLFYDNGPIQAPTQTNGPSKNPPQILKNHPEKEDKSKHHSNIKSEASEKHEHRPKEASKETKPAPTYEKKTDNLNVFKPQHTAHEEQFNDGGVNEGGSATAVYRPKAGPFKAHVQLYRNGFRLNGTFFNIDDPQNSKVLNDMLTAGKVSSDIFAKTQGPQPSQGQQIELEVDEVDKDIDYDAIGSGTTRNFDFNDSEKGQTLDGGDQLKTFQPNPAVKNNTQIKMAKTQQKITMKVEAGNIFIVECDTTQTIAAILEEIKKQGGLKEVSNVKNCVLIYQDKKFDKGNMKIGDVATGRFKVTIQYK